MDGACDVIKLWEQVERDQNSLARARLIEHYLPLVRGCVQSMGLCVTNVMTYADVLAAGAIGLIVAIDRFDRSRGVKFETFAAFRIRGAVLDAIRSLDPLSRAARRDVTELRQRTLNMEQELGRLVSLDEAAGALGFVAMTTDRRTAAAGHAEVSLSTAALSTDDECELSLGDTLPDDGIPDVDALLESEETRTVLAAAIAQLPGRERELIEEHYTHDVSLRELSRRLDVSQSRVYQIHARAVVRLRHTIDDYFRNTGQATRYGSSAS